MAEYRINIDLKDYRGNEEKITLRKCDLHGVLSILALGNEQAIEGAWLTINAILQDEGTG